jgi:succinate dehydrogenase / fumarate reductase cytochrome b subunit
MSTSQTRKRPEYRNIHITDLISYRLPLAGLVSILHRISGAAMFLLLPFVLWLFDTSLRSQQGWDAIAGVLSTWPLKIVVLGLFWALAHHLCAGIRHVLMEVRHSLSKQQGRRYAAVTLTVSLLLTAAFAVHLFTGA